MNRASQRGQVLLAVILIAVVALTIGLSLVSRSITNVRVASQSEESQRAFQAAEAGVERAAAAIRTSPTPPQLLSDTFDNQADYSTQVRVVSGTQVPLNGGNALEQDIGSDVWLSTYPNFTAPFFNNPFLVYFATPEQTSCSDTGERTPPAVEILVLSAPVAAPTLTKYVVDPCNRIPGDLPHQSGGTIQGQTFGFSFSVPVTNGLIARVIPIYNQSKVTVVSASSFPSQGAVIESTGSSGESVRKVVVYQSHPQIPIELFQYAILSQ